SRTSCQHPSRHVREWRGRGVHPALRTGEQGPCARPGPNMYSAPPRRRQRESFSTFAPAANATGTNAPRGHLLPMMKTFVLCCFLALPAPACSHHTVLSPAQLSERGTHRYANTSREKATEACAIALATLGYNVTVKQPEPGIVKTAPASIMTSATGGRGY